jgi:hypothetical protein
VPVYYRIFGPEGAISCKEPVNRRDPYLGQIEALHVPPPQTVASVIRCINRKEEIEFDSLTQKMVLFETLSSLAAMEREKHLAITNGSGPGSDPRKPLALVIADAFDRTICATNETRERTECASDWILAHFRCEEMGQSDSRWLNLARGNVLRTDGILLKNVAWTYSATGRGKQMSGDYRKILTVVHATPQNTNMMHIGLTIALVVLDVRTN